MKPSTKDQIEGNLHEVKGKVKEKAGQVTNNPTLRAKGSAEHLAGKIQKKSVKSKRCLRSKIRRARRNARCLRVTETHANAA